MIHRKGGSIELNFVQLNRHTRDNADTCLLHNMYEIILFVLYYNKLMYKFLNMYHLCNGFTSIITLSFYRVGVRTATDIVRYHPYGH